MRSLWSVEFRRHFRKFGHRTVSAGSLASNGRLCRTISFDGYQHVRSHILFETPIQRICLDCLPANRQQRRSPLEHKRPYLFRCFLLFGTASGRHWPHHSLLSAATYFRKMTRGYLLAKGSMRPLLMGTPIMPSTQYIFFIFNPSYAIAVGIENNLSL